MKKNSIRISELKLSSINKKIYDQQRDQDKMIETMKQHGQLTDITIDQNNNIISGQRRVLAAIALGWEYIEYKRIHVKNKSKATELVIVANEQRHKTLDEMYLELKELEKLYPSKQGTRTDLKTSLTGTSQSVPRQKLLADKMGIKRNKVQKILHVGDYDVNLLKKVGDKVSLDQVDKLVTVLEKRDNANKTIKLELPILRREIPEFEPQIFNKSSINLSAIPSKSVQSAICSPPYWDQRLYDNENELGKEKTVKEYLSNLSKFFIEVYRVLKDDGSLFIVIADSYDKLCLQRIPSKLSDILIDDLHFILRNEIIWRKTTSLYKGNDSTFTTETEKVLYFVKQENYKYNPVLVPCKTEPKEFILENEELDVESMCHLNTDGTYRVGSFVDKTKSEKNMHDCWDPDEIKNAHRKVGDKIERIDDALLKYGELDIIPAPACHQKSQSLPKNAHHPAPFPLVIPSILIEKSTDPGDTVLDIFCGSGTTGEAAIRLGRKFIGYEIDPKSAEMTEYRLLQTYKQVHKNMEEESTASLLLESNENLGKAA